jgi:hypothetical protein
LKTIEMVAQKDLSLRPADYEEEGEGWACQLSGIIVTSFQNRHPN